MRAVQSDLLLDMTELMLDYATSSGQQITADVLKKKVELLKKKGNESQPTSGGKRIFAFDLHTPKETNPTSTTASATSTTTSATVPAASATDPAASATAPTTDPSQTTESKIPAENQAKPSQVKAKPSPDPLLLV